MSRTPAVLRAALAGATLRSRDLAESMGVPEAALLAAQVGHGSIRIEPAPARLIPMVEALGEVMALTRNDSCVIEKIGVYSDFHGGAHAAMTLNPDIDLRLFPRHWVHAYAIETESETGPKRSIQIFDAAGDAIHKIHLRPQSDVAAWKALRQELALPDQSDAIPDFEARAPVDAARGALDQAPALREGWNAITDTHQFLPLVKKHKMNRLGAYRVAGAPFVRPLDRSAVAQLIEMLAGSGTPLMIFVGNMGCIEIHSGPIETIKPMGPWLNIMDPRFNLHLRADRIAEVYEVRKPGEHGLAISVEAFDNHGELILQIFGIRPSKGGDPVAWQAQIEALPGLSDKAA